ncbi:MAG: hypothetical protein IJE94_03555 [Oscillospiraceae bacterium]|nr:hypothetical protein [Oscillospiraceae bacterium]
MKRFIALVLSLIMALSLCAPAWAEGEVEQAATGGAVEVATADELAKALADAADAGSGDSTVSLTKDIDLTGTAWTPVSVDGYHGAGVVTVEGNGNKITGLSAPLFAGGFAGKSGIVINDLTIADSTVVCTSGLGGGAFIDSADSMHVITLDNCHLINSSVSGERAGGLIGWCSGYAKLNDGPVKAYVTITNCSVVNSTVTGAGSAGAIAGHPGASDYTYTTIENCIVKNVDVVSNETGSWRTGAIVGTANNGHVVINNVTVEDVTLTQNGVTAEETLLYGRFVPSGTGTLEIDGKLVGAVAEADGKQYMSLQAAVNAGGKVVLLDNITLAEGVTVPAGKTVELDLAGKIISQNKECTESYAMITNKGNLTITGNGKITMNDSGVNSGSSWGVYTIRNEGGKLIVENGTIENIAPNSTGNVNNAIFNYSGETTINNGVFSVPYSRTVRVWNGSVTINDGSFDGQVWAQPVNNNGCSLTINGGSFKPATNGNDGSSVYVTNGTYSVTVSVTGGYFATKIGMQAALKCISGGYFNADPTAYCADKLTGVTSDKAGYLYMVGEEGANAAEVKPADPEVEVNEKLTGDNKTAADAIAATGGVTLDNAALNAVAKDVANENKHTVTEDHVDDLKDMAGNSTITEADVVIVVQPYFDVAVNDVKIVKDATTGDVTSASIDLNITPMYQKVATTEAVANNDAVKINTEEGAGQNAVAIGEPQKMIITEPVTITVKIPDALVQLAGGGKLYVTHLTDAGVSYVYEATVDAVNRTATFTNPHGFSSFSISATDNTAAEVQGGDKYTSLQDAINNAGKDAVIEMKKDGQSAVVKSETTFTVLAAVQPTISAGAGYKMVKENVTGGVKYTFTKVTGGYYPYYPPTTTPDSELVKSPDTFDAGIALYVGVSVMGAIGTVVLGKKRED